MLDLKSTQGPFKGAFFILMAAFCLAALISLSCAAISIYKVVGQVTDANGNGIQGATVSSSSPAASTTTLSQGYYLLSFPTNGTGVTITASYQGHTAKSSPFDVTYVPQQINLRIDGVVVPTVTPTPTDTPTPTPTPTPAPNSTATPTPNVTVTPTPTATPTPTPTATVNPSPTSTPVPAQPQQQSRSPTYRPTAQVELSQLATPTPTPTPGPTIVVTPFDTSAPLPVATPLKAQSPGLDMILAMGCLLGAAYQLAKKK